MAAKKTTTKKKTAPKETLAVEISNILTAGLSKFKEALGEKKFEKRIRKAVKLFAGNIKPAAAKKTASKKVTPVKTKKKATKVPVQKTPAIPAKKS